MYNDILRTMLSEYCTLYGTSLVTVEQATDLYGALDSFVEGKDCLSEEEKEGLSEFLRRKLKMSSEQKLKESVRMQLLRMVIKSKQDEGFSLRTIGLWANVSKDRMRSFMNKDIELLPEELEGLENALSIYDASSTMTKFDAAKLRIAINDKMKAGVTLEDLAKAADIGYSILKLFIQGDGAILSAGAAKRLAYYLNVELGEQNTMTEELTGPENGNELFNKQTFREILNETPENNSAALDAFEKLDTLQAWANTLGLRLEIKKGQWHLYFPDVDEEKAAFCSTSLRDLTVILVTVYLTKQKKVQGDLQDELENIVNFRSLQV
jgi:transcriptional regulator with XRE-family HTH domain